MKRFFLLISYLALFLPVICQQSVNADMVLVVERCKALDQNSPIHNIWVDEENIKWVANSQGLFKVLALDLVQKVTVPASQTSLLNIRGGNAKIEWNTAEMQTVIGNATITCASYDAKTKSLWIGTNDRGAFQLALDPIRVKELFNTDNRKLASNRINDIFIQPNGKTWIATDDGMLSGSGGKWELEERYLNFIGVDAWGDNLWILGDNFLWQVDNRGKWEAVAIEPRNVEGRLRDIAVDDEGRVWIASNMMTGYDANAIRYQRFGPGQYFTSQFVNCLDVDSDGSIWTGTDDKGLYLIQWEAAMTVNVLMDTPLDCKKGGNTASLTAKVTGGQQPFTYKWSNGHTAEKVGQLGPGIYTITVTDSKGIVKTAKYEIPDPNLHITTELVSPSSGNPEGDGSANLLVEGGANPYTYLWDNNENKHTAVRLTTGEHKVTVTDASGCSAVASISIPEKNLPLVVFAKFLAENKCADSNDGIAEVEVSGGKAPFTYAWSNGNKTDSKVTGLASGLYSVTVTDSKGQSTSTSVSIPAPEPIQISIDVLSPAAVNAKNGTAEAKVNGGKAPYTYKWSSGESSSKAYQLGGGQNSVTVTDANGCVATASTAVKENVEALGVIVKQPVRINCHGAGGASLKVETNGGKPPYNFAWSDGQVTPTAVNLNPGNYTITVTDILGTAFTAEYTITEPEAITLNVNLDSPASANNADGRATVKASGGAGDFQYKWDNGETTNKAQKLSAGIHAVTVTDKTGCTATGEVNVNENITSLQVVIEQLSEVKCAGSTEGGIKAVVKGGKEPYTYNWQNNQTTPILENVGDGVYSITITDAAGQNATSVITVFSPDPLKIEVKPEVAASTNKQDGKATVSVTGGSGKYTYAWDNGETSAKAVALGGGSHRVTVTDGNGCSTTAEVMITENVLPLAVSIIQGNKINCAGEATASLQSQVTGGKPPYVYSWKSKTNSHSTESLSDLEAGVYTLSVTDAAGLSGKAEIEITAPAPLVITIEEVIPASTNNADGKVVLRVNGGTAPYSMNGKTLAASVNTFTIDNLKPGEQTFIVNDASGCSAEAKATIKEEVLPLSVTITQTKEINCDGLAEAALEAIPKGGKSPYTFKWDNGSTQATVTGLKAGRHTITITDAVNQKAEVYTEIKAPDPIKLTITNMRPATNDRIKDGKANVETAGGTGSFTFQWSSGETTHQATQLPLGPGYIIATDANGCSQKMEFVVAEKVLPELTTDRLASGEPIRMEKIQFKADSINIEPEAIPSLDELFNFLYDNPTIIIEVSGHTNGLPADDYCDRISAQRANSVANYIVSKGIEQRRVIAKGYGKRKPIATNQTAEGRKKNQRVEIRLIKIEE